jgi:hypothetical protein
MRALFECRLEHNGKFDRLKVECGCGRTELLPLSAFDGRLSNTYVKDLERRLRCDGCGRKGHACVSVVRADYAARRGASLKYFCAPLAIGSPGDISARPIQR